MAYYGGPDPYAFRELMGALKSQGDAMASSMDKLGDSVAKGIYAYRKRKEEQSIDMTAEATAAGLDWEGKAEGKKVSLWDMERGGLRQKMELKKLGLDQKRMDVAIEAALLSMAKTRLEMKVLRANNRMTFFIDSLLGGDDEEPIGGDGGAAASGSGGSSRRQIAVTSRAKAFADKIGRNVPGYVAAKPADVPAVESSIGVPVAAQAAHRGQAKKPAGSQGSSASRPEPEPLVPLVRQPDSPFDFDSVLGGAAGL